MWKALILFTLVTIAAACTTWRPTRTASSPDIFLARILPIVPDLQLIPYAATNDTVLPGYYTSGHHNFALGGHDLYLFPDHTYLYVKWADVLPETIADKGVWKYQHGFVDLLSDGSLAKLLPKDRQYVALRFKYGQQQVFALMGTSRAYSGFLDAYDADSNREVESLMYVFTIRKAKGITPEESVPLKAKLMNDFWHPEFIKSIDE